MFVKFRKKILLFSSLGFVIRIEGMYNITQPSQIKVKESTILPNNSKEEKQQTSLLTEALNNFNINNDNKKKLNSENGDNVSQDGNNTENKALSTNGNPKEAPEIRGLGYTFNIIKDPVSKAKNTSASTELLKMILQFLLQEEKLKYIKKEEENNITIFVQSTYNNMKLYEFLPDTKDKILQEKIAEIKKRIPTLNLNIVILSDENEKKEKKEKNTNTNIYWKLKYKTIVKNNSFCNLQSECTLTREYYYLSEVPKNTKIDNKNQIFFSEQLKSFLEQVLLQKFLDKIKMNSNKIIANIFLEIVKSSIKNIALEEEKIEIENRKGNITLYTDEITQKEFRSFSNINIENNNNNNKKGVSFDLGQLITTENETLKETREEDYIIINITNIKNSNYSSNALVLPFLTIAKETERK